MTAVHVTVEPTPPFRPLRELYRTLDRLPVFELRGSAYVNISVLDLNPERNPWYEPVLLSSTGASGAFEAMFHVVTGIGGGSPAFGTSWRVEPWAVETQCGRSMSAPGSALFGPDGMRELQAIWVAWTEEFRIRQRIGMCRTCRVGTGGSTKHLIDELWPDGVTWDSPAWR